MTEDNPIHAVSEAEELIGAGELSRALDKLEMAAFEGLPSWCDEEDTAALIGRIRDLVDTIVARGPRSHEPQVHAIRAVLASRESATDARPERAWIAAAGDREPEFYLLGEVVAGF